MREKSTHKILFYWDYTIWQIWCKLTFYIKVRTTLTYSQKILIVTAEDRMCHFLHLQLSCDSTTDQWQNKEKSNLTLFFCKLHDSFYTFEEGKKLNWRASFFIVIKEWSLWLQKNKIKQTLHIVIEHLV